MFRCELCDGYLPLFSMGRLCESCYRIRTITKCYNSKVIRNYLESVFLVEESSDEVEHASNKRLDVIPEDKELEANLLREIETRSKKLRDKPKYSDATKSK